MSNSDGTERTGEDIFRVERLSDFEAGEEPACADCGAYRELIGPFTHAGEVVEVGDMVCRECADARGANLTYCTCGTASPRDVICPGCNEYLGYRSRSQDTGNSRQGDDS